MLNQDCHAFDQSPLRSVMQGRLAIFVPKIYTCAALDQGLNQAQIVVMIENYRTGLAWKKFRSNPEIQPALDAIGFQPDAAALRP